MQQTWVIGDLHGCYETLLRLIDKINPTDTTTLYFCGDLINRGPASEKVLDFLINCPFKIQATLGNHDLAFISYCHGIFKKSKPDDCYEQLSQHRNTPDWIDWLRSLPLLIDNEHFLLVHAGIYPFWDLETNKKAAQCIEHLLRTEHYVQDLSELWQKANSSLPEHNELSFALNVFTRMRYINFDKSLCLQTKGLAKTGAQYKKLPWFSLLPPQQKPIFFGHWSALKGISMREDIICLDTGCVWKENLTAMEIHSKEVISQPYCD